MKVIHVLRKPISEGSVAQNVLKHGTGALNIDGSRIGTGRWPANLILQHLDGCKCAGVRQVPRDLRDATGEGAGVQTNEHAGGGQWKSSGRSLGRMTEVLDKWICVEGCPVKALDEQSGVTKGDKRAFTGGKVEKGVEGKGEDIYTAGWRGNTDIKGTCYAGAGGASRFFKQVKVKGD